MLYFNDFVSKRNQVFFESAYNDITLKHEQVHTNTHTEKQISESRITDN